MNGLSELLRDEIRREGPIRFHRFMQAALYHPELGYYRRGQDPFGRRGDFYTASQLQPVFGELMAERVGRMREAMGSPADFTVVELGAARQEMAAAFSGFRYVPVEYGDALPERFTGVVFSNEFFDALPVHVAVIRGDGAREMSVGIDGERFAWVECGPALETVECYRKRYFSDCGEGQIVEVNLEALEWIERIAGALESGYVFTIDYGYTAREAVRFPQGTLMSYRRHTALEDVLSEPGERDITAHVLFTALEDHAKQHGLVNGKLESLAQTLLAAGEGDQFARAIGAGPEREQEQRRLQLKHLLFGMGETFRTLVQRKEQK
jgi:SAM-dependent MidA family methyltransferase